MQLILDLKYSGRLDSAVAGAFELNYLSDRYGGHGRQHSMGEALDIGVIGTPSTWYQEDVARLNLGFVTYAASLKTAGITATQFKNIVMPRLKNQSYVGADNVVEDLYRDLSAADRQFFRNAGLNDSKIQAIETLLKSAHPFVVNDARDARSLPFSKGQVDVDLLKTLLAAPGAASDDILTKLGVSRTGLAAVTEQQLIDALNALLALQAFHEDVNADEIVLPADIEA